MSLSSHIENLTGGRFRLYPKRPFPNNRTSVKIEGNAANDA